MAEEHSPTGIHVKAPFFPHALFLFPPKIDIDGKTHEMSWGSRLFPLAPGKHTVRLHTTYVFAPATVSHSVEVTVEQGRPARLAFSMKPWSTGSLDRR